MNSAHLRTLVSVPSASTFSPSLPWFRVHIVVLNDPGRLLAVHLMHTGLVSGWSSQMSLYEILILDNSDPVYTPIWRQGCYVLPYGSRLGVLDSLYSYTLGSGSSPFIHTVTLEGQALLHIVLAGLLMLASFWHWSFWDLGVFLSRTGSLTLDLLKVFSLHLIISSLLCYGFGYGHLSGLFGPGFWTSDSKGLVGSVRMVKPVYTILALTTNSSGSVVSHHIASGIIGLFLSQWHLSSRPGPILAALVRTSSIEGVLSTTLASVFTASFLTSASMWYSSVTSPIELQGPSRYHWDIGFYSQDILNRVSKSSSGLTGSSSNSASSSSILLPGLTGSSSNSTSSAVSMTSAQINTTSAVSMTTAQEAWAQIPDKLTLYDYIGSNPAKGGLFRSGPLLKGDGLLQNWLGHPIFEYGSLAVQVRRMPAFFETFPVILIDKGGTIRADIPFRRASSVNSLEQNPITLTFFGGVLSSVEYSSAPIVKTVARKSIFGEIFTFDVNTSTPDGVWRTSARGWYSFSHVTLAFLFFFGHLWHGLRSQFRELWDGLTDL